MMTVLDQNTQKKLLAIKAAEFIEPDAMIGLGTGSTVDLFISELAKKFGKLNDLQVIPTSRSSAEKAASLGMKVLEPTENIFPDILVDGADEVARDLSMIKGGGGALLWEKIVAREANRRIYIADSTKLVGQLGKFPLPVEVVKFGHEWSSSNLQKIFNKVLLRYTPNGEPFISDSGNFIFDCIASKDMETRDLDEKLSSIPGVVTSGLFCGFIDTLLTFKDGVVVQVEKSRDVFW